MNAFDLIRSGSSLENMATDELQKLYESISKDDSFYLLIRKEVEFRICKGRNLNVKFIDDIYLNRTRQNEDAA